MFLCVCVLSHLSLVWHVGCAYGLLAVPATQATSWWYALVLLHLSLIWKSNYTWTGCCTCSLMWQVRYACLCFCICHWYDRSIVHIDCLLYLSHSDDKIIMCVYALHLSLVRQIDCSYGLVVVFVIHVTSCHEYGKSVVLVTHLTSWLCISFTFALATGVASPFQID